MGESFDELPFCVTPETAKLTNKMYLETQLMTDPLKDKNCSCTARCEETIYLPSIIDQYSDRKSDIKYSIDSNIREVIEEEITISIIKLLCQIGSIVSILTGLSMYTLVQYII
uniref:Uncharacterized protein n=1 Tax=Strigamia maritima TaxID=126957 RepID=T1JBW2_STRMM